MVELNSVISSAMALVLKLSICENLKINFEVKEKLAWIIADQLKMEQVLVNLIKKTERFNNLNILKCFFIKNQYFIQLNQSK